MCVCPRVECGSKKDIQNKSKELFMLKIDKIIYKSKEKTVMDICNLPHILCGSFLFFLFIGTVSFLISLPQHNQFEKDIKEQCGLCQLKKNYIDKNCFPSLEGRLLLKTFYLFSEFVCRNFNLSMRLKVWFGIIMSTNNANKNINRRLFIDIYLLATFAYTIVLLMSYRSLESTFWPLSIIYIIFINSFNLFFVHLLHGGSYNCEQKCNGSVASPRGYFYTIFTFINSFFMFAFLYLYIFPQDSFQNIFDAIFFSTSTAFTLTMSSITPDQLDTYTKIIVLAQIMHSFLILTLVVSNNAPLTKIQKNEK